VIVPGMKVVALLRLKTGYLGVLKWLRANGCPWNSDTCTQAAEFRSSKWSPQHLEVGKRMDGNGIFKQSAIQRSKTETRTCCSG